ncbi:hypothetical protein EV401DRAFT_2199991 [Pisolithus croceorrhizus]|nr:hypothetical protein EV401DRAFT_2199991 [Pisolithus croceorrhizus]
MGIPGGSGSILIGGLFSAMLYGLTTLQGRFKRNVQAWILLTSDADLRVLHALFRGCLDRKVPCWCRMDPRYSTCRLHVSCIVLLSGETDTSTPFDRHAQSLQIINYGVPTSLEYDVWSSSLFSSKLLPLMTSGRSFPASLLVNLLVVIAVQCFFTHKIYYLCRPRVKWLVTAPIILLLLAHFGFGIETIVLLLVNEETSVAKQIRFYASTPFTVAFALAEVLITTSLCILLYDSGTRSSFSSTKRILTTLIIYAVNRCILVLVVALAESITTVELQSAWSMAIDFVIGKSTLNTRQHLRSQGSTTESNEGIHVVDFTNTSKSSEEIKNSEGGERHIGVHEGVVVDITADPPLDKTTCEARGRDSLKERLYLSFTTARRILSIVAYATSSFFPILLYLLTGSKQLGMCDTMSIRLENVGSSKDGERWSFKREVAGTDVTTDPTFDKTATMLRRDAEV